MKQYILLLASGCAILSPGCSPTSSPVMIPSSPAPPHRGTMVPLPDARGFVELVNEPEVSDRRNPEPTSIVAYFLDSNGKSSITDSPSDVFFLLTTARGASATRIELSAQPQADDPLAARRFASKPGPYDLTALRGTLSAKIGGQQISSTFGGAR